MYANAATVLASHPTRPEPARLVGRGFGIDYRLEGDNSHSAVVVVEAKEKGKVVGYARFVHWKGDYLSPQVTFVQPGHRRRRVATALYVFAECLTGDVVRDVYFGYPGRPAGIKAFWAQPDRPFG